MNDLGGCRDEQVVRWQRTVVDHIREFVARVVRLGFDALHGGLLLAIVTMVLVEERNVIQCVDIYEEFSATWRSWCVTACCLKAAAPGTMPKVEA
jgi:hypothetical protein